MREDLLIWAPLALGVGCGVFVWAILCAIGRKKKTDEHDECC